MMDIKRSHAILAVVIAALVVYANSLWNGFAYDDVYIIQQNARVHQLRDLSGIWLTPYWPSFGAQLGLYRPFTIFAFALEWAVSGGAPWFFHLVSVLLHAAVSVLAFLLIETLFTRSAAAAGALIFAIHPLHTEAVANVVGQSELWAALLLLSACLVYARRPPGVGMAGPTRLYILGCYALALLAKESAVVLPGLLVLLDFVQGRVRLARHSLLPYARSVAGLMVSFTFLLIGYLVLRYSVLGSLTGTDAAPSLPYLREDHRVLNAFRAWPEFVRLLFFPIDLSSDYAPGVVLPVESWSPMTVLGVLLVLAVLLLTLATPYAPKAGIVAGWFLITILPVSNFLFPIGVLIAERTLYLPSLAVCFVAGLAWDHARQATQRETRRLATALAIVVVLGFGIRTAVRNPDWDSLATVWKALSRDHPESYRAQWLNATGMWRQNRPDLAERYFQIAYQIWPRDSQLLADWGNFYIGQRKWDQAIARLEESRAMIPFIARTHEYLAYAYLQTGRAQDAVAAAEQARLLEDAHPSVIYPVLAGAYDKLGRHHQAANAWTNVIKLRSGDLWLNWAMLARAQASSGRKQDALQSADVALGKTSNKTALAVIRRFRSAIENGCYDKPTDGCDPLVGWQVAVGTPSAPAR
jgi:tetratricopeptide (TPR) repeat protein